MLDTLIPRIDRWLDAYQSALLDLGESEQALRCGQVELIRRQANADRAIRQQAREKDLKLTEPAIEHLVALDEPVQDTQDRVLDAEQTVIERKRAVEALRVEGTALGWLVAIATARRDDPASDRLPFAIPE
jgi:hypothetical protein